MAPHRTASPISWSVTSEMAIDPWYPVSNVSVCGPRDMLVICRASTATDPTFWNVNRASIQARPAWVIVIRYQPGLQSFPCLPWMQRYQSLCRIGLVPLPTICPPARFYAWFEGTFADHVERTDRTLMGGGSHLFVKSNPLAHTSNSSPNQIEGGVGCARRVVYSVIMGSSMQ
jgi:hypothetical protein